LHQSHGLVQRSLRRARLFQELVCSASGLTADVQGRKGAEGAWILKPEAREVRQLVFEFHYPSEVGAFCSITGFEERFDSEEDRLGVHGTPLCRRLQLLCPTSHFDGAGCGRFTQRAPEHGRVESGAGDRRHERIGCQTAFAGFSRSKSQCDQ
jgi:hypothetical protein